MCEVVTAVSAGVALTSAAYGAYQSHKQGKVAQASAERNAVIAEQAAADAETSGAIEAGAHLSKTARLASRQRAALLAAGMDPNSEGLQDVIAGTNQMGQTDANTIRNNAAREAWGLRNHADASRIEGQMAEDRADADMAGSLLGGAGTAMSYGARGYTLKKARNGLE